MRCSLACLAVGCGPWAVGCGLWAMGCRLWAEGCGLWSPVGCGLSAVGAACANATVGSRWLDISYPLHASMSVNLVHQVSFLWRNLSPDTPHTNYANPRSIRDRIRAAYLAAGRPYHVPATVNYPTAHHVIPVALPGEEHVAWWEKLERHGCPCGDSDTSHSSSMPYAAKASMATASKVPSSTSLHHSDRQRQPGSPRRDARCLCHLCCLTDRKPSRDDKPTPGS